MNPFRVKDHTQLDVDFDWSEYLPTTGYKKVNSRCFPQVERSLQNGIEIGMGMAVPKNKSDKDGYGSYWVAEVDLVCGPVLRFRYFGNEDENAFGWINVRSGAVHELRWCFINHWRLSPPTEVLEQSPDCEMRLREFLLQEKSIRSEDLRMLGEPLSLRFQRGMKFEVADPQHPYKLWPATIVKNVGGRLKLCYDSPGDESKSINLFCTSEAIFPYGFASRNDGKYFLEPPSSIIELYTYGDWKTVIEPFQGFNHSVGIGLPDHPVHPTHCFTLGMKLETVSPLIPSEIVPATVVKVFDNIYFLIQIDDVKKPRIKNNDSLEYESNEKTTWLCTAKHPYIFPINWAKENKVKFSPPLNWSSEVEEFNWNIYLMITRSQAAPAELFPERASAAARGFELEMRLEYVEPRNQDLICAAHITRIVDDLLFIKFDHRPCCQDYIVHMDSDHLFPVDWCKSNSYPLAPPEDYLKIMKKFSKQNFRGDLTRQSLYQVVMTTNEDDLEWCPPIYFNRCYGGTLLKKDNITMLPRVIGPGVAHLVMVKVVRYLLLASNNNQTLLPRLRAKNQPRGRGKSNGRVENEGKPGYRYASIKGNNSADDILVAATRETVPEFLEELHEKLGICPNLVAFEKIEPQDCSEQCHVMAMIAAQEKAALNAKKKEEERIAAQNVVTRNRNPRNVRPAPRPEPRDDSQSPQSGNDLPIENDQATSASDDARASGSSNQSGNTLSDRIEQENLAASPQSSSGTSNNNSNRNPTGKRGRKRKAESKEENARVPKKNSKRRKGSDLKEDARVPKKNSKQSKNIDFKEETQEALEFLIQRGPPERKRFTKHPILWTVTDVFNYFNSITGCDSVAERMRKEEVDGQAFLGLNYPTLLLAFNFDKLTSLNVSNIVAEVKFSLVMDVIDERLEQEGGITQALPLNQPESS